MADLQKTYEYKIYKGSTYLGVLQNVTSDFSYSQDINSNAVQTQVEVNLSADVASSPIEPILLEDGTTLLDETGEVIYEERAPDVVGGANPEAQIQENNIVKVYEYSTNNVNGVLVFDGYIQSWSANMGGESDKVTFVALSKGVDMSDYVLAAGDTVVASNTTQNASIEYAFWGFAVAQILTPTSNIDLDRVICYVKNTDTTQNVTLTPTLCVGDPSTDSVQVLEGTATYVFGSGNSILQTFSSVTVSANTTSFTEKTSSLTTTYTLSSGTNYYILWSFTEFVGSSEKLFFGASMAAASSPIGRVRYARATANNTGFGMNLDAGAQSLYVKLVSSTGNTTSTYSSQDPAVILRDVVDNYNDQGGVVTYDGSSVVNTGLTASYTFKVASILEAVKKCLDLAPSDYYWYVNPATQKIYFKATSATADHTLVRGSHLEQITIGGTVENVRNVLYFTGGDTGGGSNLYSLYTNQASITDQGRRRLARITDNRVTVQATADLIADNLLDLNASIDYSSPVTVLGSTYNTNSINVGDTVKIAGFGNFLDTLLLQVARITRRPDSVDLTLGVLLQRQNDALTDALNDIADVQTVDNPSAPS